MQSSSIGKVYLIRLYMAFFTALALAVLLLVESFHTFPLPYMFQGASLKIDTVSWAARFQANTLKIMTVPLLLGNVLNLMMWAGAKLDMVEIETLFALKKAKERRLFGVVVEEEEEDFGHAVEATLRQIDRAHEQGEYTSEQAEELESLLLQTRAEKELFDTQIVDLKAKIERQQGERADTAAAVKSSAAFLGRGFHDIEMLLEAGFASSSASSSWGRGARRRSRRRRRRRRARTAGWGRTQPAPSPRTRSSTTTRRRRRAATAAAAAAASRAAPRRRRRLRRRRRRRRGRRRRGRERGERRVGGRPLVARVGGSGGDGLRRAAGAAGSERGARAADDQEGDEGDGGRWGGIGADGDDGVTDETRAHEREAAEVRRVEFMSVAQSKGKRAQIGELSARVDAEKEEAAALHSRLELAVVDEQAILKKWQRLDEELQEAEVEKAAALATKNKEKEAALGRAQLAGRRSKLKEGYRELRRKEKVLREVEQAELDGQRELAELKEGHAALGRQKEMWSERLAAADEDRAALGETQRVELEVRREKAKRPSSRRVRSTTAGCSSGCCSGGDS